MTAAEVIAALQTLPPDMPVLVQGYETGWDEIHAIETRPVERYGKAQPWDGEYQDGGQRPAVVIVGRRDMHRKNPHENQKSP
ncbi:MAG: hypothetical protein KUL86_01680 [Castellaniella sp.]|nr:hypothetical protein [Castellaniella sp.]